MGRLFSILDSRKVNVVVSDMRKLGMNLIPFPRVSYRERVILPEFDYAPQLHFLMPSFAPFYDPKAKAFQKLSVPELTAS